MTQRTGGVVELTGATFDEVVKGTSPDVLVVVSFYAPWCPKCRTLEPVLDRVVSSLGGKAMLAMVNVDTEQSLGYRFQIEGVPTVMMFRGGQKVGEFIGALPEPEVRRQIESLVTAGPARPSGPAAEAEEALKAGHKATAERLLREALRIEPSNSAARLMLGRLLASRGETLEAEEMLRAIQHDSGEYLPAQAVLAEIRLRACCAEVGDIERARERLERYAGDLDARLGLGCCLAAQGMHREALDEFLRVLQADRSFRGGAARDAMIAVFLMIGQHNPLADEYRRRAAELAR